MPDGQTTKRLRRLLMAATCGVLVSLSSVAAHAGDDDEDDDTFEQKIIKNILGGMGVDVGRPGIEYRERSPLVIPPSLDLPPPQDAAALERDPTWPKEQQAQRKKKAVAQKPLTNASPEEPGTSARMTPDELRRGSVAGNGRITDPSQSGSQEEPNVGRPLSPKELGGGSIFSWSALTGSYKPEQSTFTGEPARSSLTQPPPGYQTPSASQPYGIGEEKPNGWKIPNVLDRPVGNTDN